MFEDFKQRRAQRAAERSAAAEQARAATALHAWQAEQDELEAQLELVTTYQGQAAQGVIMQPGEAAFAQIGSCALLGEVKERGHFVAGSQGLSIPIGSIGGRAVRYRVGATRGHYEPGEVHVGGIDEGQLVITDQRILFLGAKKTIECKLAKVVSAVVDDEGVITVAVSNRQSPMSVAVGSPIADWLRLRLDLAVARFQGQGEQLAEQVRGQLAAHQASRPGSPQLEA